MFKKLSKIKSNDGVVYASIPSQPGVHCPMHTSLSSIRRLDGVSSLVVGMPECTFYSRYVVNEEVKNNLHYSYILDSSEVVFGSAENIKDAMITMVKDGAKNVIVIKTCIPSLIGEDIEQMAKDVNEEFNVNFVVIDLAHYKTNGYTTGFQLTSMALLDFIECKPNKQVNLLGDVGGDEYEDLKLHISTKYQCLSYGYRTNYQKFLQLGKGEYNVVFSANFLKLAMEMKERFGIPYVYFGGRNEFDITSAYDELELMLDMKLTRNCHYPRVSVPQGEQRYLSLVSSVDGVELIATMDALKMNCVFAHIEEYTPALERVKAKMEHCDPRCAYVADAQSFLEHTDIEYDRVIRDDKELMSALNCIGSERLYKVHSYLKKIGGDVHATV